MVQQTTPAGNREGEKRCICPKGRRITGNQLHTASRRLKLPECMCTNTDAGCNRSINTDDAVVVAAMPEQEKIFEHVYVYEAVVIMLTMKNDERENNI